MKEIIYKIHFKDGTEYSDSDIIKDGETIDDFIETCHYQMDMDLVKEIFAWFADE